MFLYTSTQKLFIVYFRFKPVFFWPIPTKVAGVFWSLLFCSACIIDPIQKLNNPIFSTTKQKN